MRSGPLMSWTQGNNLEDLREPTLAGKRAAELVQTRHRFYVVELAELRAVRAQRMQFPRHHFADVHHDVVPLAA